MLAEHDVAWFEEPLSPDALDDFQRLREHSRGADRGRRGADPAPVVPALAAGPRASTSSSRTSTKVGGISEERRIAWMALDNGVAFVPHGWNTALGLAADLQLASAHARAPISSST